MSTSSSFTSLGHLPTFVAEHWWETVDEEQDEADGAFERVTWLAEVLVQYVVAGLTADLLVLHPERVPKQWSAGKEDKSSRMGLGTWRGYAQELAEQIRAAGRPSLLPAFTDFMLERPARPGQKGRPTQAGATLDALVKLRNEGAHSKLYPTAKARKERLDQARRLFRDLEGPLGTLGAHPLWVATACRGLPSRRFAVRARSLMGDARRPVRVELELDHHVEPGQPFFVGEHGWLVFAAPLVRCVEERALVFHRWEDGPVFRNGKEDVRPGEVSSFGDLFAERWSPGRLGAEDLVRLRNPGALAAAPLVVPGFHVVRPLGAGGTGQVFLARRTGAAAEPLALKRLRVDLAAEPTLRDRLRREYETMRRLRSPGVARVHELVDLPDGPVLVMEYVDGESLTAVRDRGPLPVAEAIAVGRAVLDALREAHGLGIVHRDVKPSNLLRGRDGRVRLIDFGIAHLADAARLTGSLEGLGTRGFAAPEQAAGEAVDARADVYAVGRLVTFLASLGEPNAGAYASLPGPIQAVVRRATSRDREHRFPDAGSMMRALELASGQTDGPPVGPGHFITRTVRLDTMVGRGPVGCWLFYGTEMGSQAPVTVVLAEPGEEPRRALATRVHTLRTTNHPLFALLSPLHDEEGLAFHLLRDRHPEGLFPKGPARTTPAATPTSGRAGDPAPPRAAAGRTSAPPKPAPPRPVWRPVPPEDSVLDALGDWALLGVSVLVPPVGLGRLAFSTYNAITDTFSGARRLQRPPYLGDWAVLPRDRDLHATVRVLDHLALLVVAQSEGRSLKFEIPLWQELIGTPVRPTYEVLLAPGRWPKDVRAHLEVVPNRKDLVRALVAMHRVAEAGERVLRPEVTEAVGHIFGCLQACVALGAQGLAPEDVGPWVVPHDGAWALLDLDDPAGVRRLAAPSGRR